jgi:hypothetical protein
MAKFSQQANKNVDGCCAQPLTDKNKGMFGSTLKFSGS